MLNLVMRTEGKGSGPVYIGDGPGLIQLAVHKIWRHQELKAHEGKHDSSNKDTPYYDKVPHVVFKVTQMSQDKSGDEVKYLAIRKGSMLTLFGAKGSWGDNQEYMDSAVDITVIDLQSYRAVSLGFECDREVPIDRMSVRINKIKTGNCSFPVHLRPAHGEVVSE